MEFGILFTSHPNTDAEPYPHRDVHARVTRQILHADELGYDYAWVAEHHFSNEYGIMPDVFVYAAYLAAQTQRIKIGTAVVTLPLANPLRVAENTAFVDILSNGRFALGLGSGYRKYEFDGFGIDFDARRDIQEEALPLLMDLFHSKRADHQGKYFDVNVSGPYELFPHALQTAASADLSCRRNRSLDRRRRPHGLWPVSFQLDAVCRTGAAERGLSCAAAGNAAAASRKSGARPRGCGALGLRRRHRRQGQARKRAGHHAQSGAFWQRPHLGLSRHRLARCRRDTARLRRADPRHYPARLAGDRDRQDRRAACDRPQCLDHAAFPAVVRR